jgi:hypothetical protein
MVEALRSMRAAFALGRRRGCIILKGYVRQAVLSQPTTKLQNPRNSCLGTGTVAARQLGWKKAREAKLSFASNIAT